MFLTTQEKYHAARRWVLLRCCAVCCRGRASFKSAMPLPRVSVLLRRRAHLFMLMPAEGFAYTKGAPKTYRRPDKADAVTREFYAVCGTYMISRRPGLPPVVLKIGTLDNPLVYGRAQMAIFTVEGQPFHLIADGVSAFEGLPPRR